MSSNKKIAGRLSDLVRQNNRRLAVDAMLSLLLGGVFSLLTFGFIFWIGWYGGLLFFHTTGLPAWQFGASVTGLFFVVAVWSAWRRVDPLAGFQPLSHREQMHRLVSFAVGLSYFSPHHATAGAAIVLLGGPVNCFKALGIWMHRIRANDAIIADAARLLGYCDPPCPIEELRELESAVTLYRLGLVKIVPCENLHALSITEKGRQVLGNRATPK